MARRLGIRYIIWNYQQITFSSASYATWRPYTGTSNPHTDHVHFSFSLAGANQQTTWFTTNPKPASWYPGGATLAPASDYNGDGRSDMMVYRPSEGNWYARYTGGGQAQPLNIGQWGDPADRPLNGDYDGDGRADMMIFRPSTGEWLVKYAAATAGNALLTYDWGGLGDVVM